MAGKPDAAKSKQLETQSIERRKLIGQAIIDGILSPADVALINVASDPDYNQGQGNYTQRGGDHKQGGGDYNQAPNIGQVFDPLISVIRTGSVIRG